MAQRSVAEITQLLQAWGDGDERALDQLMPLVYEELRRAAQRYMVYQPPDHTLQTSALVNEAYLRLVNFREVSWQDRAHFFAMCAKLMRRILIDFARSGSTKNVQGEPVGWFWTRRWPYRGRRPPTCWPWMTH